MAYYQGDYYQGDFWKKLKKGAKRLGRNIGKAAGTLAPLAAFVVPAVGTATLVGRGLTAARKIKRAGRLVRSMSAAPAATLSPATIVTQLTGTNVGTMAPEPLVAIGAKKLSGGSETVRRIRAAKKKRGGMMRRTRARTQYRRRRSRARSR